MDYYMIRGHYCGHDKTGAFHCECGKCELLYSDDRDISEYCGKNRGNSGNGRNANRNNKPFLVRLFS